MRCLELTGSQRPKSLGFPRLKKDVGLKNHPTSKDENLFEFSHPILQIFRLRWIVPFMLTKAYFFVTN